MADRRFARLSHLEAQEALYLDLEGASNQPPVLAGVLRRPGRGEVPFVQHDIVDPLFAPLGAPAMDLAAFVRKIVARAEARDLRIVTWSEHDLRAVRTLRDAQPELVERFEARYANARRVAERWRNRCHDGDRPPDNKLASFLRLIRYEVPPVAAPGRVGETVRTLRARLAAGREPTRLQVQRWAFVLEHNRHDCNGMRAVCLAATADLDAALQL